MSVPRSDLGAVRILFGTIVLLRTTPLLAPLHLPYLHATWPLLGWPQAAWHVPMWGPLLPASAVAAMCVGRTIALVLFTVGIRARASGVAAGALAWAAMSQNAASFINTFHLLYLGLVVLAMSGAGSARAVLPEGESDPASGLALTRAFVASVYAWSGLAKLNASWLSGEVLARLRADGVVRGPIAEVLLAGSGGCTAAAWAVALTEIALAPLLLGRRTRGAAMVAALAFHAVLQASVHPDFFGFAMAVLLLAFVENGSRKEAYCCVPT